MIKDTRQGIRIWDLPTRLFHWTLAAALAFMFFSAKSGGLWLAWHLRCGLLVAALIIFRLCWGLWGSDTARFARFVRPRAVPAYLRGQWDENRHPGHNPLGGLMVVLMLAAVLFQTATGLFAADGNTFINNGYLNGWIGADAGETVRAVHIRFSRLLAALAVLHIAAVLFYRVAKKRNLVTPMITGRQTQASADAVRPRFAGRSAFCAAALIAAASVALVWLLRR